MPTAAINLSPQLWSKVKKRATECGHSAVDEYVLQLVLDDLKLRAALKATQSVRRVRPAVRGGVASSKRLREPVEKIRKRLLDGMVSYMKFSAQPGYGYACGYRLKDVHRCAAIVDGFLENLGTAPRADPAKFLESVKKTVLKLNKLNRSCDGALIATDQREDLCLLIRRAAQVLAPKFNRDVTEAWRDW